MGEELYEAAKKGPKCLEMVAEGDALGIFGGGKGYHGAFVKTLRFGGTLNLIKVCFHILMLRCLQMSCARTASALN